MAVNYVKKMESVNLTFEQPKWILKCHWKTGTVEYPPRSPNPTPLHFFLWGAVKNSVYTSKLRTLQDVRRDTEITCAAVPLATIQNVCQSVARQQCISDGGGHFKHL
jgi:hypothetical protein